MDQNENFGQYLKGALAGKSIEKPTSPRGCAESFDDFPDDGFVDVSLPPVVSVSTNQQIKVRIRHFESGRVSGLVSLIGEETDRGTVYDFQAPIVIEADQQGTCIIFNWAVPSFPTKVRWSASVSFENRMGVGLSNCSASTLVSKPVH